MNGNLQPRKHKRPTCTKCSSKSIAIRNMYIKNRFHFDLLYRKKGESWIISITGENVVI